MTAAFLREAADTARRFGTSQLGEDFNDARHIAVADWLDMTAGQVANYGPNMDSPWTKPHAQMAEAVARAYLGRDS